MAMSFEVSDLTSRLRELYFRQRDLTREIGLFLDAHHDSIGFPDDFFKSMHLHSSNFLYDLCQCYYKCWNEDARRGDLVFNDDVADIEDEYGDEEGR